MPSQHRILIVDDSRTNRLIMEEILAEHYRLVLAEDGEQALEIAPDFLPDIILLDIMMPGIDGYETCRRIRANPALEHIKIIMVSAKAMVEERLEGYAAGADDYMTKPFQDDELLAKVRVFLRLKSVEEVDQLKSDVLSLLGHETRTPLNGLISPAEMLMSDEDLEADERKMLAEMVWRNARRLHRLFEKVMTLSELKSGKAEFRIQPADLGQVVRNAAAEAAPEAAEHGVTIHEDCCETAGVEIDREHSKRVITALLDNAIRFSPAGGSITAQVRMENGQAVLTVTDRGAGVDPDFLPHVFDDFTEPDVKHHSEGHGLSLAIARQIVLRHNGTILAESAKGAGTTFTVRLPAIPTAAGAPRDQYLTA